MFHFPCQGFIADVSATVLGRVRAHPLSPLTSLSNINTDSITGAPEHAAIRDSRDETQAEILIRQWRGETGP